MVDKIVEFLTRSIDIFGLFSLKVWLIGLIALAVVVLLIVVFCLSAKKKRNKGKAKKEPAVVKVNEKKNEALFLDEAEYKQAREDGPANEPADELIEESAEEVPFVSPPEEEPFAEGFEEAPFTEAFDEADYIETDFKEEAGEPASAPRSEEKKVSKKSKEKVGAQASAEKNKDATVEIISVQVASTVEGDAGAEKKTAVPKGKYVIQKNNEAKYRFSLLANNGSQLFESDEYSTAISCRNAIPTFRKYIAQVVPQIVKTPDGDFQYIIKRPNGSYHSKPYDSESAAASAAASVQKFCETENIVLVQKR
jgi:uncharacterized protein YegP (UPF0339 family)/competence protein ComGC